jgi:hypothetical protein
MVEDPILVADLVRERSLVIRGTVLSAERGLGTVPVEYQ